MSVNGEKERRDALRTSLARIPATALVLFVIGLLVFGAFAFNLETNGPLVQPDQAINQELHQDALNSPPWTIAAAQALFIIGRSGIIALGILFGGYWLWKHCWRELTLLILGSSLGSLWFVLLAKAFNRQRPVFSNPVAPRIDFPGFPSGHVIAATLFYGLLAYLYVPRIKSRFWRVVVVAADVLLILLIGLSRLYEGGHYLSDVLAGYAVALAWGSLSFMLIDWYFLKRKKTS